ncbi:nicotinate-nucleotide--dimethylbenzimidazole phosphoribosyltransferase [Streptomyces ardesiacus]|uniref:nicotinate-nucleotide--dimethylbenzimidazole phosphoribosyltransferase n=1 Tax=Streptomyces ardesiacus TaxID=285564 RepID=UPI003659AB55
MTDTGQIPGEGLPENAGMVEQPGVPAPGAYTYLSEATAEDEDLLLLPGAQSAWGNEVAPPAPEPVVETVHQPGPHEMSGRDSGSVDLGGVRLPDPAQDTASAPVPPRRPLHLGPPIPDTSASPVRSLADRGPADVPVRQPGPPTVGPEYLDVPQAAAAAPQAAAPWGPQPAPQAPVPAGAGHAETVVPVPEQAAEPEGAAQALVTRVATEAVAATGTTATTTADGEPGASPEEPAPQAARTEQAQTEQAAPVEQVAEPRQAGEAVPGDRPEPEVQAVQAEQVEQPEQPEQPEQGDAAGHGVPEEAVAAPAPDAAAQQAAAPVQAAAPAPVQEAVQAPEAVAAAPGAEPAPEAHEIPEQQSAPEASPADASEGSAEPQAADAAEAPAPQEAAPSGTPGPEAPEPAVAEPAVAEAAGADAQATPVPEAGAAPEAAVPDPAPEAPQQPAPPVQEQPAPAQPAQGPQSLADTGVRQEQEPAHEQELTVAEGTHDPAAPQAHPEQPVGTAPAPTGAPVAEPQPAPAQAPAAPQTHPEQPVGRFVPVDGAQVPTTPHLAPTPPESVLVPPEAPAPAPEQAAVPAPRESGPGVLQSADDLDTRGAGQEDHAADAPGATHPAPTATPDVPAGQEAPAPQEPAHDAGTTAAAEARRPAGPAAPAYDDAEREAVLKVMRERRDIRNGFRSDPIPHEVLLRVLEAAHTAPSVGHSQPWDFVVIRSADTRRAMHELAMRQRDAYAKSLPKGRAKQFKELKIEAILDTPVNIVVTADPTRGGRHTLGRHTQPQMAPYSSALAVENLWLAARAEGLGVGWVSFFDEREMVRALGLPEHLDVVAYLCVGYVDEFPDEPELMQAGWSKRRPLSWVVHEETYGRRALPGEAPHDLLAETVAQIRPLDAKALGEAWERQKRMTKPAGALGMLEIISAQLSGLSRQCPPPVPEPAAVAVFAGDHGVHAQGVTPWPQEVTAQMVANFLGGGAVCNAFATQVGAEVCVVDVGVATDLPATPGLLPRKVRAGTSDMTTGAAMTREEAKQAIEVGIETARDLVAAGNKALLTGEMGIANTTASAALISVFTGADPAEVTGRGTGINDETLARKTEVVRRALELHQPDPADPIGVLAAVGGFEHAAMVGLLLGGASLRTPVILDGVSAGAAALVARAIAPEVLAACIAGHRSAEPGHVAALNKLGLRPLVDLDLRLGEGTGALLALPMVQSTARAMHEVATFDSAGVTEK